MKRYLLYIFTALLLASCSTTRRLPHGEQLYTGVKKVAIASSPDGQAIPPGLADQLKETVDVAPNNYIKMLHWRYPFPLGLWVYNNWPNPDHGFKHWIYNKLAAEPVLVSDVRPEVRTHMLDEMLDNNGYFRGSATYTINTAKNPRKASITYTIDPGPAYLIDSIQLLPETSHLFSLIDSIAMRDPYLVAGSRFCTDSLGVVRTRITNKLRNQGYYYFRPEYIEYLADSLQHRGSIALKMTVATGTPKAALTRWSTGDVTVRVNKPYGGTSFDTIPTKRGTLIQMMPSRLRHALIPECVTFRRDRTFKVRDMERTQTYLARLGIFNAIDIDVEPDTLSATPRLNVDIDCTFDTPLEASIEVNASSKSNSYIGPGATFSVTNRNLFGGGEQLSVALTGTYEWQTGHSGAQKSSLFNSYEIGLTGSLAFPRLIAPKFIPRRRRELNWTRITLNADLLNRPHYFKMAQFNMSYSYEWQASRHVFTTFTPFKLTYTKLINTTQVFDSITAANPAIALSFRSQFIPQIAYTYNYNRYFDRDNGLNVTWSLQEAGNLFWGIYQACGVKGEKKLFGTPFSQFVKGQFQVVYNRRLAGDNWLVSRVAVGAAHAYGNSSQVPYSEQFYVGGANSIRAFTVRSIGPGSYHAPSDEVDGYFDQTGTFKFEANVEYRFPIVGPIHGALFIDSGNVWLLKNDPQRPGGKLRGSSFLKDLALGTGAGIRLDISMLVVRADLGIGIHAPYDTGKRGYYNMTSFGNSLAFHLAIGYPF
ncbi:MAG: BamA/TamA family outer membrane protein [Muribaculaceae bacterium]|nr:BamA/TamA family outer membrane protein [Muribaculaceae bacterium]